MAFYVIYYTSTGEIKNVGEGNLAQIKEYPYPEGLAWLEIPEWIDHNNYVDLSDLSVRQKTVMSIAVSALTILADGNDTATITGIPAGTEVMWPDGQTDIVNDGEVRLSVDLPGTYTLRFSAIPYLDEEVTIEAVSAT